MWFGIIISASFTSKIEKITFLKLTIFFKKIIKEY